MARRIVTAGDPADNRRRSGLGQGEVGARSADLAWMETNAINVDHPIPEGWTGANGGRMVVGNASEVPPCGCHGSTRQVATWQPASAGNLRQSAEAAL
jgi:hypothetical protein